jgi:hypothetical protein
MTAFLERVQRRGQSGNDGFLSILLMWSAAGLLFFSVLLPTGSVSGIPVKHFFYISFAAVMFLYWARVHGEISIQVLFLLFFSAVFTFGYMLVGLLRGVSWPSFIFSEGVGFFTTISVVLLAWICKTAKWLSARQLLSFAFYGALAFSIIKSLAAILVSIGFISYPSLYGFIIDVFGYRIVSGLMFGGLVRVSLIIYDFFVLFMMVLVLVKPALFVGIPRFVRFVFFVSAVLCVFFAYSRLLFGVLALLFAFMFLFRFTWRLRFLSLILFVAILAFSFSWVQGTYEDRFQSKGAEESDRVRLEQIEALVDVWGDTPLIGGGFGYFARQNIRDYSAPYSYEVQWVGFLAKLGALGILFPIFLVGLILLRGIRYIRIPEVSFVLLVFVLFVLGGLTNQYLITSGAAVFYLSALLFFDSFRRSECQQEEGV